MEPSEWTLVAVVSRFASTSTGRGPTTPTIRPVGDVAEMDRIRLEELAAELLNMLETVGVAEAPRAPSIAVTPLALYRPLVGAGWSPEYPV
jgi:hypothetical protein